MCEPLDAATPAPPAWKPPADPTPANLVPPPPAPAPGPSWQPAAEMSLGDLRGTLPQPAPTPAIPSGPSWLRRRKALVLTGAGLAAVAMGGAVALALFLKPAPTVAKLVPSSADVYVSIALDPSATQKLNLLGLVHKFPDFKTDASITQKLNDAFKGSGWSFTNDVQPWLGAEAGAMIQLKDKTPTAIIVLSRDDTKAKAALGKLRSGTWGKELAWKDQTYAGIRISVGTPLPGGSKEPTAYAYVDHAVVVANSDALIREIIDTDRGKHPRLTDSANFKTTVSQLPTDRLALLYVNGSSTVSRLKEELRKQGPAFSLTLPETSLDQLDAFTGLGFTVAAKSNGIAGELRIAVDESKLDTATRAALNVPSHKNAALGWVPQHSYGLLTVIGLNRGLQQAVDKWTATDTQASTALDAMGFTGPNGALTHLTGDAGLEFGGNTKLLSGALLLGTDDDASLRRFLSSLASFAEEGSQSIAPSLRTTSKEQSYHGVTMTVIDEPDLSLYGVEPTVAVTGGMGIIATSPQEMQALIDAHEKGGNITTAPTFAAASREAYPGYDSLLYLDIGEFSTALRSFLPSSDRIELESQLGSAAPVKAFLITAQVASNRISERLFVLIDTTTRT